jgi:hypothetical protein
LLYALEDGLISIVGAADTLIELEAFVTATDENFGATAEALGVKSAVVASLMDLLTDDTYQGFKKAPVIIEHLSVDSKLAFNEKFGIEILKRNALIGRADDMLHAEKVDPYSAEADDQRSLEEIHGLDKEDKWDRRSDDEKEKDEENRKMFKEGQKKGDISGDSFGPNPNRKPKKNADGSDVSVTDIKAHRDYDTGEVVLDDVLAQKGLHEVEEGDERTYGERNKEALPADRTPNTLATSEEQRKAAEAAVAAAKAYTDSLKVVDADDEDLEIDTAGHVAIYHKVEVMGAKLDAIRALLTVADIDLNHTAIVQRNNAAGCWFAFIRQIQAEESTAVIITAGISAETYAVNDAGERLAPKGIQVVDQSAGATDAPRPWNFRSKEIGKMTAAEKKANWKTVTPDEFVFCGAYEGPEQGTVVYITPRSYFRETNEEWNKPLDIQHILPMDLTEVSPGVYRSKSRDWNHVSFDMNTRGFKENLLLQVMLNNR